MKCKKGTTVVFLKVNDDSVEINAPDCGMDEIRRLKGKELGTNIDVIDLTLSDMTEKISSMTSIDGAMIVDSNAKCHCYGVILDGVAQSAATPSVGARHNSARLYLDNCKKNHVKAVALVVSEDKSVTIYT